MGQYFKAYVGNKASKNLGKMMEFGYMPRPYVDMICTMIYQNPQIVAFVGDYASGNEAYDAAWNQGNEELDMSIHLIEGINKMYLVNHTKNEYVYLKEYYELNNDFKHNRCMHPLALLASIGNNGHSGGDYLPSFADEENSKMIGSWALDCVNVEKQIDNFIAKKYNEIILKFPLLFDD